VAPSGSGPDEPSTIVLVGLLGLAGCVNSSAKLYLPDGTKLVCHASGAWAAANDSFRQCVQTFESRGTAPAQSTGAATEGAY
jgi:hypothetical protein